MFSSLPEIISHICSKIVGVQGEQNIEGMRTFRGPENMPSSPEKFYARDKVLEYRIGCRGGPGCFADNAVAGNAIRTRRMI